MAAWRWPPGRTRVFAVTAATLCMGAVPTSVVDLHAELRAAEALVAELRRKLHEAGAADGDTATPRSCAPPPTADLETHLPPGSYNRTCTGCARWAESVQCDCLPRDGVEGTAATLAPSNVTGMWTGAAGAKIMLHALQVGADGDSIFSVVCAKSPAVIFDSYNDPGCTTRQQPRIANHARLLSWHGGNGTVLGNQSAVLYLDNGELMRGTFNATGQSFYWSRRSHTAATQTWVRDPQEGRIRTSLSLSACHNTEDRSKQVDSSVGAGTGVLLSNEGGHLHCEWKRVPPPRVGRLIDSRRPEPPGALTTRGSGSHSVTHLALPPPPLLLGCRVLDHVSFVAPQFKQLTDPLLMLPSLNLSALRNKTGGSLANISGLWTGFNDDGETQIMQNDLFKVAEWANHTEWPDGMPADLKSFRITCASSGDYSTCSDASEFIAHGEDAGWHVANATLNTTSRVIRVHFGQISGRANNQVYQLGIFDEDYLNLYWQSTGPPETHGSSLWSRQSGTEYAECCYACETHLTCQAWTLDQRKHTCMLASSAATAYPAASMISGYPLRSDPASTCEHKFIHDPVEGAWQDNDVPKDVMCVSMAPAGHSSKASDFPRRWHSNTNTQSSSVGEHDNGGGDDVDDDGGGSDRSRESPDQASPNADGDTERGRAWFFLPSHSGGRDGSDATALAGYWTVEDHPIIPTPPAPPCIMPPCPKPPVRIPVPSLYYIEALGNVSLQHAGGRSYHGGNGDDKNSTRVYRYRVVCLDGGDGMTCDPLAPGFNGSSWHKANLTVLVNTAARSNKSEVRIHYDSEDGEPHARDVTGLVDANWSAIAWKDGSAVWARSQCRCSCQPPDDPNCNQARCVGARMTSQLASLAIRDKPWVVFFHGGAFKYYSAISGNYYDICAKIARLSGIGVLSIDYRTTDSSPSPTTFPGDLVDVVHGMQWLKKQGACEIMLFGDSSGGSDVLKLLLWMEHQRRMGHDPGVNVSAAVAFSGWLDMTASGPTYETRRWVDGKGNGMGDAFFRDDTGLSRLHAMCAADVYSGKLPINHPLISPLAAPDTLIAALPPLMLVVGGAEQLVGGNLAFAQRAAAVGARVQVEVFSGMWHDFEMSAEGCGANHALDEGESAYSIGSTFLASGGTTGCHVVCEGSGDSACAKVAPVRWHFKSNSLPPVIQDSDCPASYL